MRAFVCNWKQIAVGDLKAVTTGSGTSERRTLPVLFDHHTEVDLGTIDLAPPQWFISFAGSPKRNRERGFRN
ncbi:hypothetical protein CH300_12610 [Rhodococcus sp. 15-1154-1]|nr:hypothetical protein CH300_12610 [Rhodococcus sp. 15-1154-1]